MTNDERQGIEWWNSSDEQRRAFWLRVAVSAVPADAWAAFKQSRDAMPVGDGGAAPGVAG